VTAGPDTPGAFFGRRKGKQLRPGQDRLLRELLPDLRITLPGAVAPEAALLDPAALFPRAPEQVWLEIGFGGGEHLAFQSRSHPEIGFIGVEPFVNGVAKLLGVVDADGTANIRLWDDDATKLLPTLAPGSVDRVYLLYPDPWPKRRQRKRRFVSDETLLNLARVLKPGGEFRFATDIDDYAGWTLARVARCSAFAWTAREAADWRRPWPDWPGTRYEAKAFREGRKAAYLTFRRL
jgi:tRNA (guanine-N7-)-methyltransferase